MSILSDNKSKISIFTNDVETTSIVNNTLSDKTGELVLKEGMPRLLDLYEKYNVKTTFFFTGYIAERYPEVVRMILPYGHEVASHGYTHRIEKSFDLLLLNEQIEHLKKSKAILEDISGQEVISFRAPAARVNKDTAIALMETGFKVDSSVASQRFDFFLSFGNILKLNWLIAPRNSYFTDKNNLWKKGDGEIFEIPISAMILPYIGTTLRISPFFTKTLRHFLKIESGITSKPIVFLTHPNEFIDEEKLSDQKIRRAKNIVSYILGDLVRHSLKQRNLGLKAIPLLEQEIKYFSESRFTFVTCKELYLDKLNKRNSYASK